MAAGRPQVLAHRAWDSLGNGALFTTRIRRPRALQLPAQPFAQRASFHPSTCLAQSQKRHGSRPAASVRPISIPRLDTRRVFRTSAILRQEAQAPAKKEKAYKDEVKSSEDPADQENDDMTNFKRSEKAAQASRVNLSAKLSSGDDKDGKESRSGGWREIVRLLRIAQPEWRVLSLAFGFLLVSSSVSMSLPFSIGKIIDAATKDQGTLFGLPMEQFYIALGTLLAAGACANYGRIILLRIVGERIVTKLRSQLFKRTFVQNAEFFDANRVGDLISRLGSDTIIVGKSITQNVSDGLRSLVSATAGLTLMTYVSVKLTGVLAIFVPPVGMAAFFYGRAIRNLSRRIQKNLGTLTKIAEERLSNVRTSQSFAGEIQEVSRYNNQVRNVFKLGRKEAFISASFFSASGFMGNMTFVALLYVGGAMVRSGGISIGDLTSFLMYAGYAGSSLFGLSAFYSELMKGVGAASRLFELQDRNPEISPTKGDMVKSARGVIQFKDVNFSYPTRPAVEIFKDLNFRIDQGSNVAIVAPSGAGKSTVASLLLRFYQPTKGVITINGRDISSMNAKQLRRKIGYVGQEPVLFSGSIAENIAYGKPLATRSEIVAAARQANCQFISDFPEGLETFVGARGTQLSGGQKQRIAIARALLKNPDILILDEATSALDAESETMVNQALTRVLQGQNTTISIAHRLSTIQRADRIICIGSDGRVAQTGTYTELAADKEGAFAKLMEWQMSGGTVAPSRPGQQGKDIDPEATEEEHMRSRMEEHDLDEEVEEGAGANADEKSSVKG